MPKDFLDLRPVYHWTDQRVRGHIAVCVLAAVIEAVIANQLTAAGIDDANRDNQTITSRRALAELNPVRVHHLTANERHVTVTTRPNPCKPRSSTPSTSAPTPGTTPPSPELPNATSRTAHA